MSLRVTLFLVAAALVAVLGKAASKNDKPEVPAQPPAPLPTYTTKYDNINVDMILRNERLLKSYIDCLMDRKPCTREGAVLKEILPDALRTECARCSPKQKEQAGHILAYLLQYKKKYWDELVAKYDPEGSFRKKYEVEDDEEEEDQAA